MSESLSQTKGVRQKGFGDIMLEEIFFFFCGLTQRDFENKCNAISPKSALICESGVFLSGNSSGMIIKKKKKKQMYISHLDAEVAIITIVLYYKLMNTFTTAIL